MSEIESISIYITNLLNNLSKLKKIDYHQAEKYFTQDFHYLNKDQTLIKNSIYHFLENLNDRECRYEIQKIKLLSKNIYLVHLKYINGRVEKIYHNALLIHGVSIIIIKRIKDRYLISDAIEFKNDQGSPIYSVLEKFS